MTKEQETLHARAAKLRGKIVTAETELDELRRKLATIESKLSTEAGPSSPAQLKTGLDMLWAAALPKARERSSRHRCRTEWNRIPIAERPTLKTLLDALKAWNRCEAWRCDGNAFVPGLHRFIKERLWEDLPEDSRYFSRHAPTPKPPPPEPTAEDKAALAEFLKKPLFGATKGPRLPDVAAILDKKIGSPGSQENAEPIRAGVDSD